MKSLKIQVRLNPVEAAMLEEVRNFRDRGRLNISECLRMLVHREYRRRLKRKDTPSTAVGEREFVSDMRVGRPAVKPDGEKNHV